MEIPPDCIWVRWNFHLSPFGFHLGDHRPGGIPPGGHLGDLQRQIWVCPPKSTSVPYEIHQHYPKREKKTNVGVLLAASCSRQSRADLCLSLRWPEMMPNSASSNQTSRGGNDDRDTYSLPPLSAEGWDTKRWSVAERSGGALTGRASYEVCMGPAQVAPTALTSGPQCAPASVPLQQYAADIQEVSATLPTDPDSAPWSSASPRFTSYTSQPSWLRSSNPSAWAAPQLCACRLRAAANFLRCTAAAERQPV